MSELVMLGIQAMALTGAAYQLIVDFERIWK
jgi:hypothetical protein